MTGIVVPPDNRILSILVDITPLEESIVAPKNSSVKTLSIEVS